LHEAGGEKNTPPAFGEKKGTLDATCQIGITHFFTMVYGNPGKGFHLGEKPAWVEMLQSQSHELGAPTAPQGVFSEWARAPRGNNRREFRGSSADFVRYSINCYLAIWRPDAIGSEHEVSGHGGEKISRKGPLQLREHCGSRPLALIGDVVLDQFQLSGNGLPDN
jgi:hypothetical protein